ncbi:MAG TPA: CPBP family intramembrane glutamic endopeptidase [Abditibacteriaceae bacterium]
MKPEDLAPTAPAPDAPLEAHDEFEEWDDTPTALGLRALFTLLAGGFLLWAQWHATINPGQEYARWVWLSVIANFLLPACIVWLFFAQTLRHIPEIPNQAMNAWNYGWNYSDWKKQLRLSLILFAVMLPFLWFASRDANVRAGYSQWFPAATGSAFLINLALLAVYLFCWEWFFRGFLLFGIAQGVAWPVAVVLQAVLFGFAHWGKPVMEMWGAFGGGAILGVIAWREKSFLTAFLTHYFVHAAWVVLIRI